MVGPVGSVRTVSGGGVEAACDVERADLVEEFAGVPGAGVASPRAQNETAARGLPYARHWRYSTT
jgi:hypothetical protein